MKTPWWFAAIIIFVALPMFTLPALLSHCPSEGFERTLIWIFPFYLLLGGWLSWRIWPERPLLAWLMVVMMLLSDTAIWLLVIAAA